MPGVKVQKWITIQQPQEVFFDFLDEDDVDMDMLDRTFEAGW